MSRSLYSIGADLLALEQMLIDCEGDVTDKETEEAIDRWLATLGAERDNKITRMCGLITNLETNAVACAGEIKRLQMLQRANENGAQRLKDRLKEFFQLHRITKLDLGTFRPQIRANGGKAPLIIPESWEREPARAPEAFQRHVIQLDKEFIRDVLEAGDEIEGCYINERGTHLRLR